MKEIDAGTSGPVLLDCQTGGKLCRVWCEIFPALTNPPGFTLRGVIFGECFAMDNFYGGSFTELHEQAADPPVRELFPDPSPNTAQAAQDGC